MADPRRAASRLSRLSRPSRPVSVPRIDVRRRVLVVAAGASVAILATSLPAGFGAAGAILVATLWIRVAADAVMTG